MKTLVIFAEHNRNGVLEYHKFVIKLKSVKVGLIAACNPGTIKSHYQSKTTPKTGLKQQADKRLKSKRGIQKRK